MSVVLLRYYCRGIVTGDAPGEDCVVSTLSFLIMPDLTRRESCRVDKHG